MQLLVAVIVVAFAWNAAARVEKIFSPLQIHSRITLDPNTDAH